MKTVAFSGHRKIGGGKIGYVEHWLPWHIKQAISDGYTRFISGFADGIDLMCAAIVAEEKKRNPEIILEAAIPYRDRLNTDDPLFRELIGQCDHVHVVCEEYAKDCYRARNTYLVEQADKVIAVFNGNKRSGTAQTINIARKLGRELFILEI